MSESPATARSAESELFQPLLAAGRLPAWLPPVLATLYDGQDPDVAARWGRRVVESCRSASPSVAGAAQSKEDHRTPGQAWQSPPLAVAHDWQERTVLPLIAQACQQADVEQPVAELRRMHARAAEGERFDEAAWRAALEPVLRELYRQAYDYAEAYATAHASASAYARANNFSPAGAVSFADSYATSSTDSNRDSFAESNAVANAAVLATAYASGDPQAYAEAYPSALARACAQAWANAAGRAEPVTDGPPTDRLRRLAYARLADGLADSCAARIG
jgi:hypothetical protein